MKKSILSVIFLLTISFLVNAQNVNIPDANFKDYLVGDTSINTNNDTEIQLSEAIAFSGAINCNNLAITDLTGIEDFTGVTELFCSENSLNSLDVSNNTSLTHLSCSVNSLSSLDVSNNISLVYLACYENSLNSLDVSNNISLTHLFCSENSLNSLDVSNNTSLTHLNCSVNSLSSLDVSNNISLVYLACYENSLSSLDASNNTSITHLLCFYNSLNSLDVSNNTSLMHLYCFDNFLSSLNVSDNTSLEHLVCSSNSLNSLDVSNNSNLIRLDCYSNLLTNLNVANGNNFNFVDQIAYQAFNSTGNPNLTCITVDDDVYSTTNWINIDSVASFSLDCAGSVGINEAHQKSVINVYPNPVQYQLFIDTGEQEVDRLNILDLSGKVIKSLDSKNIKKMDVSDLQQGIYILEIYTNIGASNTRFVIE